MPTIIFPANTRPGIQLITPFGTFNVPQSLELHVSQAAAQWFKDHKYTVKPDYMQPSEEAASSPPASEPVVRKPAVRKSIARTRKAQ